MLRYNCIIIEDEPLAIEILAEYISLEPSLRLLHICTDAIAAIDILKREKIDLLFLDIHLPKLKGLDFLAKIDQYPSVIITSAYHQYALESYNYKIVDYLLKPIEFNRFLKSITKLKSYIKEKSQLTEAKQLMVNVGKKKVKINISEIIYIESAGAYVKIFTLNELVISKLKISTMEDWLKKDGFLRIHRSYLVAKDKIKSFTATFLEIEEKQIPIGRNYKINVLNKLGANK